MRGSDRKPAGTDLVSTVRTSRGVGEDPEEEKGGHPSRVRSGTRGVSPKDAE